jgi:hypothetical protein
VRRCRGRELLHLEILEGGMVDVVMVVAVPPGVGLVRQRWMAIMAISEIKKLMNFHPLWPL